MHGDLTTRNILLDAGRSSAKIRDLGLSKTLQATITEASPGGTLAFAAPEVLLNMRCNEKVPSEVSPMKPRSSAVAPGQAMMFGGQLCAPAEITLLIALMHSGKTLRAYGLHNSNCARAAACRPTCSPLAWCCGRCARRKCRCGGTCAASRCALPRHPPSLGCTHHAILA